MLSVFPSVKSLFELLIFSLMFNFLGKVKESEQREEVF